MCSFHERDCLHFDLTTTLPMPQMAPHSARKCIGWELTLTVELYRRGLAGYTFPGVVRVSF